MKNALQVSLLALFVVGTNAPHCFALSVPYTESFDISSRNWKQNSTATDAIWVNGGGPEGAGDNFLSATYTTPSTGTPNSTVVVFRGRSASNSSDGNFFGNWLASDDFVVDFWFRHNAPTPITAGLRIATPASFPGITAVLPDVIQPNTWTHLTVEIDLANPYFNFEDMDDPIIPSKTYSTVLSNIGNVQVTANLSAQANSTQFTFDLDQFTVVPEPGSLSLAGLGLISIGFIILRERRSTV